MIRGDSMKPQLISILALIPLFFGLAGCGKEADDDKNFRRFGQKNFNTGQCDNDPLVGADMTKKSFQNPMVMSDYFGKLFFPEELFESLDASSFSVGKAIHNQGVDIFRVNSDIDQDCRYFDFLETPNEEANKKWSQSQAGGIGQAFLLGLFTTTYTRDIDSGNVKITKPTIMLLDQTQKWTLLHEMSHFLFAKARITKKRMAFNSELETQANKTRTGINQLKRRLENNGRQKQAIRLILQYEKYFDLNHKLDARTALEEFTIESMLLEYSADNLITGIKNTNDPKNAFQYMVTNSTEVLVSYRQFLRELRATEDMLFHPQWGRAFKAMKKLKRKVRQTIQFINNKLDTANQIRNHQAQQHEDHSLPKFQNHDGHHFDIQKFKKRHLQMQSWN